jgi:hypothetical protein
MATGQQSRANEGAADGCKQRIRQPLIELLGREELGLQQEILREDREDQQKCIDKYDEGRVSETVFDEEGGDGADQRQRGDRLPVHLQEPSARAICKSHQQEIVDVPAEKAHGPCPLA